MTSFEAFFVQATGSAPAQSQIRLARDGLPPADFAPARAGGVGIVLAWLWDQVQGADRAPRRLIYALPQASLVEPTGIRAANWLERLALTEAVALDVVLGGGAGGGNWRREPHRPAIVIGTADMLVSKALNRGYGVGSDLYPVDFALVTNGAHWVIEEPEQCQAAARTLRQILAWAQSAGTAEPVGLTFLSAGQPDGSADEDALGGSRTIRRLAVEPGAYREVAAAVGQFHQPGAVTLVVLNSVQAAREVFAALPPTVAERTLVHPRFRGLERAALAARLIAEPSEAGHIVVADQAAEIGLELDADVLVTEAAPWPSIMLRASQCRRSSAIAAQFWWLPPATWTPYEPADVDAAIAALHGLESSTLTNAELAAQQVRARTPEVPVLSEPEFVALFDSTRGVSPTAEVVAPYLHDLSEPEAQLCWATWTPEPGEDDQPGGDGRPPADAWVPAGEWRCRAPISQVAVLAERVPVWRRDRTGRDWTPLRPDEPARPGEALLVAAADGGYDPVLGFDPARTAPVVGCPSLDPVDDAAPAAPDRGWMSLRQHSEETRDQAVALVEVIKPQVPVAAAKAIGCAAYLHDVGKSHPIWQDALCAMARDDDRERVAAGRPWAKSGTEGRLLFAGDVAFRHELASLLLLDGPLRDLIDPVADADLTRYLVLAHHGKLRTQVRDPAASGPDVVLGLVQGATWSVPPLLEAPAAALTVSLEQFGADGQWTSTVLALLDRYGPFTLAYLETLVRVADWRASGGEPLATHRSGPTTSLAAAPGGAAPGAVARETGASTASGAPGGAALAAAAPGTPEVRRPPSSGRVSRYAYALHRPGF
jgi:CRISPR-associated endonuclease/helicase Cas3